MKPRILIVGEEGWARNIPHTIVNLNYGRAVAKAGGLPVVAIQERCINEYAELCDGLLLTDGPFVHVGEYGDYYKAKVYPELHRRREIMELALVKRMIEMKKPVLGINRGMRVLNVFFGGSLKDDGQMQEIDRLAQDFEPT